MTKRTLRIIVDLTYITAGHIHVRTHNISLGKKKLTLAPLRIGLDATRTSVNWCNSSHDRDIDVFLCVCVSTDSSTKQYLNC